jgi:asparaginyl-tRNA synthetase
MLIKDVLKLQKEEQVLIKGWVRSLRKGKKTSFLNLNDGSSGQNLQIVLDTSSLQEETFKKLALGACLIVEGKVKLTPQAPQPLEVLGQSLEVIGSVSENYPLQKKEISFEYLREKAHFRPRTATFGSLFRLRSGLCEALFNTFFEDSFSYIHAPILSTSDAEGAGEAFFVSSQDPRHHPFSFSKDFFESPTLLAVTGQLEAEIMCAGLNRVFTFAPIFRAENSNTARHLAEFWMLEPEIAFFDAQDTMVFAEKMIKKTVQHLLQHHHQDLEIITAKSQNPPLPRLENALRESFQSLSYEDAVNLIHQETNRFEEKLEQGNELKSEHERFLSDIYFQKPVFLTNFPSHQKAFYAYENGNGTTASFDLLMPGIGEVIGGTQREHRFDELEKKMTPKQKETLGWYLELREEGTFPHSGFGLGLERFLSWITGFHNVRDLIPFPRTPGHCNF